MVTYATKKINDATLAAPGSLVDSDLAMMSAAGGVAGNVYTRAYSAVKAYITNAFLAAANIFTAAQTINANAAAPPTPLAGTLLHIVGADAVSTRFLGDSFGAGITIGARRAEGTNAAKTASQNGNTLLLIGGGGYGATGYAAGFAGQFRVNAAENWTDLAQGAEVVIHTTPLGSVTQTARWVFGPAGDLHFTGGGTVAQGEINAVNYFVGGANLTAIYARLGVANTLSQPLTISQLTAGTPPTPITGTLVHIIGPNGVSARMQLNVFGAGASDGMMRANGTSVAPSALLSGENIAQYGAGGFGATVYSPGFTGQFRFNTTQNWTDAARGTQLSFHTTPNGSATQAQRWVMEHDGSFYATGLATPGAAGAINAVSLFVGNTVAVDANGLIRPQVFTVAALPAAIHGARAHVSDALAPVFGALVAGGGAVSIPVYGDAAPAWRVG